VSKAEPVRARPPEGEAPTKLRAASPDCQEIQAVCGARPKGSGSGVRTAPTEQLTEAHEGRL
jgi:hypothetical protein